MTARRGATLAAIAVAAGGAGAQEAAKHALVIGVQEYPAEAAADFPSLGGPRNDGALMVAVLRERLGFASDSIVELYDRQATLERAVGAIAALGDRARPGDEVLLYYSGHGSRVVDASGLEREHRDSSLVLFDSRARSPFGAFDLSDDALWSLLRPLTTSGVHVTVITDCCHSGSVVRGAGGPTVRAVPPGTEAAAPERWTFWPEDVEFLDDHERLRPGELTDYVHLSACTDAERAYEASLDGTRHGILTWALARTLRAAAPTDTWRRIARRVARLVRGVPDAEPQSPAVTGDRDREVFSGRFRPPPPGFGVRLTGSGLHIDAGRVHGLDPGCVVAVAGVDGEDLGKARVVAAGLGHGRAEWLATPRSAAAALALRAEIVERPAGLPHVKVAADETLLPLVAEAPWAVRAARENAHLRLTRRGGRLSLATAEGIPRWSATLDGETVDRAARDALRAELEREAHFRALWDLPRISGDLDEMFLEFVPPSERHLSDAGGIRLVDAGLVGEGPELSLRAPTFAEQERRGERRVAVLRVQNANFRPVHAYVLSLTEDREIQALFPDPEAGPGSAVLGSDHQPLLLRVWVGSAGEDTFPLERPMRDRYLVVTSETPLDLAPLLSSRRGSTRGDGGLPGALAAFARRTRGGGLETASSRWGAACIDVRVERGQ